MSAPSGGATAVAAQPRGLPSNPAQGIRRAPLASNVPPPPPIPEKFNASISSSVSTLSAAAPLSASQVIGLAREAMASARQENETQAAEASGVSTELKPGITIDLSRRNILELPDEVVDIIKGELERSVAGRPSPPPGAPHRGWIADA